MTSNQLCAEQIKNLLDKYKEPEKAKRFLIDAGIIDEHGNLMPQYQPEEGVTSQ
jgi:hypothetical protein